MSAARVAADGGSGRGAPRPSSADFAFSDLNPTAQRIVQAARRVLVRDGYAGLTLRAIGSEAGETKSLIVYHFGGKDGLVTALVDSLWHDEDVDLVRRLRDLPGSPRDRVRMLIDVHHALALEEPEYRMYFDLLPSLMRDARARRRHAELNETYRMLGVMALEGTALDAAEQRALAGLLLAADEGAAVLLQIEGTAFDHDAVFALLSELSAVRAGVGERADGGRAAGQRPARDFRPCQAPPPGDPSAELAPVARRLLDGAMDVLAHDGLAAVTFEAVAEASGEPRSATTYYYGEKRNLLLAIHETLVFRARRLATGRMRRAAAGGWQQDPLSQALRRLPSSLPTFRSIYELLPALMRDDDMRAGHARFLTWLRTTMAGSVAEACGRTVDPALLDLTLALSYGLAIQLLLDRRGLDAAPVFDMWDSLLAEAGPAG